MGRKTKKLKIVGIAIMLILFSYTASAKDYKIALVQLATSDMYVSLMKAIAEATGNNFEIQIVPSARALFLVENNLVDAAGPGAYDPASKNPDLTYDVASTVIAKSATVLYTNNAKPVTAAELMKGNPAKLKIETTLSMGEFLKFEFLQTTNVEASMKKISSGNIDGFIYPQTGGDALLKRLGVKNVRRQLFYIYDTVFRLPKGKKGGEFDKVFSDGIAKLKANGKWTQVAAPLLENTEYVEWQPE